MLMRVKTFSVTRREERDRLGDTVTAWLQQSEAIPSRTVVRQSSDSEFHCLTIVVFYTLPADT